MLENAMRCRRLICVIQMLRSDLYHSDALNFFQITKMLLFPDQIAKILTLSEKYSAYSRSTLYMLICITRMLLFDLYRLD